MHESLGFAHFLAHADGLARFILALLCAASVGTWYLVVIKAVALARQGRASRRFLDRFWNARSIEEVARELGAGGVTDPFSHLVHNGFAAVETLRAGAVGTRALVAGASGEAFLTRALKRAIDEERQRLEYGQAFLASAASSAPFIGLFGTVWGIYHALIAIGVSGQGTLDKVASPVGEALIMTGIGLAVAIPAALAYNFFGRAARTTLAQLNGFAHDVFALLATGVKTDMRAADPAATSEQVLSLVEARARAMQPAR